MLKVLILSFTTLIFMACVNSSSYSEENKGYDIVIDSNIENFYFLKKYHNQLLKKKVKDLISQMFELSMARKAYADLENLGKEAIPYIIMQMDDYRKLVLKTISFKNKSRDAFEGVRHIRVETVTDVLSEILTQLEGKRFSYISNYEKSNEDRRKDIYQWKLWLQSKGAGERNHFTLHPQ